MRDGIKGHRFRFQNTWDGRDLPLRGAYRGRSGRQPMGPHPEGPRGSSLRQARWGLGAGDGEVDRAGLHEPRQVARACGAWCSPHPADGKDRSGEKVGSSRPQREEVKESRAHTP